MRLSCILVGAALMTVGLAGCGGGIQEGIEPGVDMTKTYETEVKADMGGPGKKPWLNRRKAEADLKKAQAEQSKAAPGGG